MCAISFVLFFSCLFISVSDFVSFLFFDLICSFVFCFYLTYYAIFFFFFFFQAEDGIRDLTVTGVQTCALPICRREEARDEQQRPRHQLVVRERDRPRPPHARLAHRQPPPPREVLRDHHRDRSEERRVGKECRSRWSPDH